MAGGAGSSTGGVGGQNGGAGGTTICPLNPCIVPVCQFGTVPPATLCGCPTCAPPPDAGAALDAPTERDGPLVCTASCPRPNCPNGTITGPPPCNCAICAPIDAGQIVDGGAADGPAICANIACPMIACVGGYIPGSTPCDCPTCAPVDSGEGQTVGAACGSITDPLCGTGMHCEWSDKLCGSRTHGACVSFPGGVACAMASVPVCGCDGGGEKWRGHQQQRYLP